MKTAKVTPIDGARDFHVHELFFSTTNRQGIIQSGNDVFVRVSGYAEAAMLGQPHNLIRHPDMPRAVFRLIWDYLQRGKAVAGYVKNMAADGRYYWVVAVITPLEQGYLSVRFKPTGPLLATIDSLYREMRAIETAAEQRGETGPAAMDLAAARLTAALRETGHADYDAFMAAMLRDELRSRDSAIAAGHRTLIPLHLPTGNNEGRDRLEAIYQTCLAAYGELNQLYAGLDHYLALDRQLRAGFAQVTELADRIRLVAINANIKASQLGVDGHCTGVVADFLGRTSTDLAGICAGFSRQMQPVAVSLQAVVFNLAVARLQLEMILLFNQELAALGKLDESHGRNLDVLQTAFDGTIGPAVQAIQAVETALRGFYGHSDEFAKLTMNLLVAQTAGAIEASRLTGGKDLDQTFGDLRQQAEGCRTETARLDDILSRFDSLAASSPAMIRQINAAIQATRRGLKEFVALLDRAAPPAPALLPEKPEPSRRRSELPVDARQAALVR